MSSFNPDALRKRLAARDRHVIPLADMRASAVLVPVILGEAGPRLLLTKRTDRVGSHQGQICFPGGCVEPADPDLLATALRESEEEVGLSPSHVNVLGPLDDTRTLGTFRITPFLGLVPDGYPFRPAPHEVDRLLLVPLAEFQDPARLRMEQMPFPDGRTRPVPFYSVGDDVVWGATARIIHEWLSWMGTGGVDKPISEA